jgi:hypothetical protein
MGKFNYNENDFEEVSKRAEEFYSSIGNVYCAYFKEKISFNISGLKHLKFKTDKVARKHSDQYARLKLIKLAPQILLLSRTVQGIWHTKHFERIRMNNRTETILKPVSFYEFIAVLDNVRVKVIIKQIDNGQKFFWSIIPYWGIDSINSRRVLHSGNPEGD